VSSFEQSSHFGRHYHSGYFKVAVPLRRGDSLFLGLAWVSVGQVLATFDPHARPFFYHRFAAAPISQAATLPAVRISTIPLALPPASLLQNKNAPAY
jgi:hypothetical protein